MEHPISIEGSGPEGKGLQVGDRFFDKAVLRRLNAQELVSIAEAAEVLKLLPNNSAILIQSPALANKSMVLAMVARLESSDGGDAHPGPLHKDFLKSLSAKDYDNLLAAADLIDRASTQAVGSIENLGRDAGTGEAS